VAVSAEQDWSFHRDGEVKLQPPCNAAFRTHGEVQQLDCRSRQATALTLGGNIAQQRSSRVFASPRVTGGVIIGMACPNPGGAVHPSVYGRNLKWDDAEPSGTHHLERGGNTVEFGALTPTWECRAVTGPGCCYDQLFDAAVAIEISAGEEDMPVLARSCRSPITLVTRKERRYASIVVTCQRHQRTPDGSQQVRSIGESDARFHRYREDSHVMPSAPYRPHQAETEIPAVSED
jgi:hypothetical protein